MTSHVGGHDPYDLSHHTLSESVSCKLQAAGTNSATQCCRTDDSAADYAGP
jgi:hypothetical protein